MNTLPANCKLRVRHKRFYKSRVAQDLDKLVRLVDHESYLTIKYAFAYSRKEAEELKLSSDEIVPRGGKTEVDIVNEKNEVVAKGEALAVTVITSTADSAEKSLLHEQLSS